MEQIIQSEYPVYQQIAFDIAEKIIEGKYTVGEKIFGRSTLAGQYRVSPETIRRAMAFLRDLGIVEIEHGSGVRIASLERARQLLERDKTIEKLSRLKDEIEELSSLQLSTQQKLYERMDTMLEYFERFSLSAPILPYEIVITDKCLYLGKCISELEFWKKTGVTVVAIRRKGDLIISPGPLATFETKDVFVMIGPEGSLSRVRLYLYGNSESSQEQLALETTIV